MGYTTDFDGYITIDPPLSGHEISYLNDFAKTRRYQHNKGPYYITSMDNLEVVNINKAPEGQPGLWCQWEISSDGARIHWDGGEKFYHADEWMKYLINTFLTDRQKSEYENMLRADWRFHFFTFDHTMNGTIEAQGEDNEDRWLLHVADSEVVTEEVCEHSF